MIQEDDKNKRQRKTLFSVIYIFFGLFVLLIGYFSYYLIFRSSSIINSSYNRREEILSDRVIRGKILASDYSVLAETVVDENGKEIRQYPYGEMFAHVVGRSQKGFSGLEESENIRLLTSNVNSFDNMYHDLVGEKNLGDNIVTTLDVRLQQVAYNALGNNRGAVVVMEPSTGKILAMVSKPSYDPNKINEQWEELVKDEGTESALLNRAAQGLYPPGSTFKLLTTLEFIRENYDYQDYVYNCKGSTEEDGMVVHCHNNKSHGKVDLKKSFAKSCNTSYANIGKELDISRYRALCEDFLFNRPLPVNMASSISSFELKAEAYSIKEAMQTAFGQGRTLVTPIQNALIAATVANDGVMMKPYVVDRIENADKATVRSYRPQSYTKPMSILEADYLTELMRAVVTDGTAKELESLKIDAAGKTGSADQNGGKPAHAWFIGFAPADDPQLVVSIVVESVGTGSEYAVPIAREIFAAYFNK